MSNLAHLHVPLISLFNYPKIFTKTGLSYCYSRSPQAAYRFSSSADPRYSTNRHRSTEYSSEKRLKFPILSPRVHRRSPQLQVNGEGSVARDAQAAHGNASLCLSFHLLNFYIQNFERIISDLTGGVPFLLKHNRNSKAIL
jgi:hypothetical protein